MAVELEIKFCTTKSVLEQIKAGISGEEKQFSMETTYYDTPDRDLSARHITLRRRMENDLSVCTLKAPAKTGRLEFELEKAAIEDAIPELCKLSGLAELPALLEKGVVKGMLSLETIFHATMEGKAVTKGTRVRDLAAYLPLDNAPQTHYTFISPETTIEIAEEIFKRGQGKKNKLRALLVTENGEAGERLLGILTPYDILG